jgi:hypothetical protein
MGVTDVIDAAHNTAESIDHDCHKQYSLAMLQCSKWRQIMEPRTKPHDPHSPLNLLTELAVEATSSLVEAQRTLLNLAKEENDIFLNGIKERIGFLPGVAMTELVQRSLDTVIGMQQELLTTTSKQTLQWLESERAGKAVRSAHLIELAQGAVETFTRAQKKFLEAVAQEASKAVDGKHHHETKPATKTEIAELAGKAANAFIEAQKSLLDVMGQQMNVNLDLTTRSMELMSASRLLPMANLTGKGVKSFLEAETSLIGSLVRPKKKVAVRAKQAKSRGKRAKAIAV